MPAAARTLAARFWPGPLTLILPRASRVPLAATGGQATVGVRVPNHPVALALLRTFGSAVAAPSANRFGRVSPTTAAHVEADLGADVDLVLDGGACEVGIESTIVDLSGGSPVLLRPGRVSAGEIAVGVATGGCRRRTRQPPRPRHARGALRSENAPGAGRSGGPPGRASVGRNRWRLLAFTRPPWADARDVVRLAPRDAAGYAHDLYAALRELDRADASLIVIERPPGLEEWSAVADRLRRASAGR